ncbi:hypothetical protein GGD64_005498 [Bradyrhizobium sp. CIR3A]|nr:hypothetical protein [Bradyrhizobium sp. CIR3A]NYG47698.1 hypothetical protein [Bradyrhizobium sp. IAR9]
MFLFFPFRSRKRRRDVAFKRTISFNQRSLEAYPSACGVWPLGPRDSRPLGLPDGPAWPPLAGSAARPARSLRRPPQPAAEDELLFNRSKKAKGLGATQKLRKSPSPTPCRRPAGTRERLDPQVLPRTQARDGHWRFPSTGRGRRHQAGSAPFRALPVRAWRTTWFVDGQIETRSEHAASRTVFVEADLAFPAARLEAASLATGIALQPFPNSIVGAWPIARDAAATRRHTYMKWICRLSYLAGAVALAFTTSVSAMPVATPNANGGFASTAIEVKGGHGHGGGHGWGHRGGRGHHYGWGRGRGHHYGWSRHRHW